jgi:hypothetical protein
MAKNVMTGSKTAIPRQIAVARIASYLFVVMMSLIQMKIVMMEGKETVILNVMHAGRTVRRTGVAMV